VIQKLGWERKLTRILARFARTATNSGKESVMAKSQPAQKFRVDFVAATIWMNDKFYNVVLTKT
jgi:hypothetical protein